MYWQLVDYILAPLLWIFCDQQTDWQREAKPLGKSKFCINQSMVPFAVALGLRIPS